MTRTTRRRLAYGGAGIVAVIFALAPLLGAALDLLGARSAFNSAVASAQALEVAQARLSLTRGAELAARAERRLQGPPARALAKLPLIGNDVRTVRALAAGARKLAPAALQALKAADAFPRGPDGPQLGFSAGRLNLEPWPRAAADLDRAAGMMRAGLAPVTGSQAGLLPPVRAARNRFLKQGAASVKTLESGRDALGLIPYFFGADKPRKWLLIIQNPSELRGTGGFLGAFGILSADSGKLALEEFASNEVLPQVLTPPETPADFARQYDQFGSRVFWPNSNLSPDFPAVAKLMSGMWKQGRGSEVDGVIAIDAVGLSYLLRLVGPIEVPPVGEMTPDNFLRIALNEAYIRFTDRDVRSRFLIEVGRGVYSRMLAGKFSSLSAQVDTLGQMVATKRLQVWIPDQQKVLENLGVAGNLQPKPNSDFLMVVGNNAGGNKLDYYSRRRISYRAVVSTGSQVSAAVEVETRNNAPDSGLPPYILGVIEGEPAGLLRAYTSVFMPAGSSLTAAGIDGKMPDRLDQHTEGGLAAVSAFVDVASRTKSTFSVRTTRTINSPGLYRLVVQQQPSLHPDRLDLLVSLPPGSTVTRVSEGMIVEGDTVRWTGYLSRQREFLVRYDPPRRSSL